MKECILLPQWLDDIIFNEYKAVYNPSPEDVMSNADKDYDFAILYLGTYFPRSYAEAYCIFGKLLDNKNYYQVMDEYSELNILDFCCGTGGEIFGIISILHERLPNLRRIHIDAFDANSEYIKFLFHLGNKLKENIDINVSINPQCYYIGAEQHLQDIVNYTNSLYHIVLSCKALNEFIQHDVFPNENIYEKIARTFLPCLDKNGLLLLSDLSHKDPKKGLFYPEILNKGFNSLIRSDNSFKSFYPYPCFFFERKCQGCYMQDIVYVSHSRRDKDISKIAYRIIGETAFVEKMMSGVSSQQLCRANKPSADKSVPYQSK